MNAFGSVKLDKHMTVVASKVLLINLTNHSFGPDIDPVYYPHGSIFLAIPAKFALV